MTLRQTGMKLRAMAWVSCLAVGCSTSSASQHATSQQPANAQQVAANQTQTSLPAVPTTPVYTYQVSPTPIAVVNTVAPTNTALPVATGTANSSPVVTFNIASGTGSGAWNTRAAQLHLQVGQTIHIVNNDQVEHRLHTNGDPCEHGSPMAPGESYDCVLSSAFSPDDDGPLYDHNVGSSAPFWFDVSGGSNG